MKAAIIVGPGRMELRDITKPCMSQYDALVRMELVAICNSTDTKLKDGHFPGFNTYPCTLGHEGVGTVVDIGEKVISYKVGDRVLNACTMRTGIDGLASGWGTMAEYALAGDHAAMSRDGVCDQAHGYDGVFETQKVIPEDIPSRQAILMATWREVWSSFSDFGFEKGQDLFVIGGGPVGLSFVALAICFGLRNVALSTRSSWKLAKAVAMGAGRVFQAEAGMIGNVRTEFPAGFDYVIDAVGSPAVMSQALQLVKADGTIGVYGTVPDDNITLVKKGAPYNWRFIMHQWPDYSKEAAAHEPLCRLIREGKLDSNDFITHEMPFDRIDDGFKALKENKALKVILSFFS